MSHYQRPVKPGIALVIAYPDSGRAVIHEDGCGHAKRFSKSRPAAPHDLDEAIPYEDFYEVAPCAASGKAQGKYLCQKGGCEVCA